MEREQDECRAYRARLLEALRTRTDRERAEEPDVLQIVANQETVGTLDCDAPDSTLILAIGEPIRTLEIRTASGLLVGGLSAPELGVKRTQCRMGRFLVELDVQNTEARGTVRVSCRTAQEAKTPSGERLASMLRLRPALGMVAQVVLAAAVIFLVADRFADRSAPGGVNAHLGADTSPKESIVPEAVQQARMMQGALIQGILDEHKHALTEQVEQRVQTVLDSSQTEQGRLRRQIAVLETARTQLSQEVAALKARGSREDLRASTQKFERRLRDMQNTADVERARLQDEIKSLFVARNSMNREIVALKKRENEHALKQQAVVMARILSPHEIDKKTAEIAEVTVLPGLAGKAIEAGDKVDTTPFTFWVSFQDGTSEENIERLIRTIEGRMGTVNGSWYNVEVSLPKPQTPEALLETLKREKIVKAVAKSRNTASENVEH